MGFREAIERLGRDSGRREAASQLCEQMRQALQTPDFPADPERIYRNLDSDHEVPDGGAGEPASRVTLIEFLVRQRPPDLKGIRHAVNEFCRSHKLEGPANQAAATVVLGRVWSFRTLNTLYRLKGAGNQRVRTGLRHIITTFPLEDQQKALASTPLGEKLTWAFYNTDRPGDPFGSVGGSRAEIVDRLGLGEYNRSGEELVLWGHRLPPSVVARKPTAWDGGVRQPYWFPCGRTRPLSADGGGTRRFSESDGQPEVVHEPVTGQHLAVGISFLAE